MKSGRCPYYCFVAAAAASPSPSRIPVAHKIPLIALYFLARVSRVRAMFACVCVRQDRLGCTAANVVVAVAVVVQGDKRAPKLFAAGAAATKRASVCMCTSQPAIGQGDRWCWQLLTSRDVIAK